MCIQTTTKVVNSNSNSKSNAATTKASSSSLQPPSRDEQGQGHGQRPNPNDYDEIGWEDKYHGVIEAEGSRQKSAAELKGELYDPVTGRFLHHGPDAYRHQGTFTPEVADEMLNRVYEIWQQSFLAYGLDLTRPEARAHFVKYRANVFGDIMMTLYLSMYLESCRHFTLWQNLVTWTLMFNYAGCMFGLMHMNFHSLMLDYHWTSYDNIGEFFATMHHRLPQHKFKIDGINITTTYTNQMLTMMLGTLNKRGTNHAFDLIWHLGGAIICWKSVVGRNMISAFLINWLMEPTCHSYIHNQNQIPPVTGFLCWIYASLGVAPTKAHHMGHHDTSIPTRWTNFADFNLPHIDLFLNWFWDWAYYKYYHRGELHSVGISMTRSWYIKGIVVASLGLVWMISYAVGMNATPFCCFVPLVSHTMIPFMVITFGNWWKKWNNREAEAFTNKDKEEKDLNQKKEN